MRMQQHSLHLDRARQKQNWYHNRQVKCGLKVFHSLMTENIEFTLYVFSRNEKKKSNVGVTYPLGCFVICVHLGTNAIQ